MSSRYKFAGAFSLHTNDSGLLIPFFCRPHRNCPFVHTVKEDNTIQFFSPYWNLDCWQVHYLDTDIDKADGEQSLIVFKFKSDIIYFDSITILAEWVEENKQDLSDVPLLECGLLRIARAPLGRLYLAMEHAAERLLSERNRKSWINDGVLITQQNRSIWHTLEAIPEPLFPIERVATTKADLPSETELLTWLSSPKNYDSPDWEELWLYAEERFSSHDVLFGIGFTWVGYIYANWHLELYDHVSILGRLIQKEYIAFSRNHSFIDFLSEVFCDSFEDAIQAGFPFQYHKLAIELSLHAMSVDDQFDFLSAAFAIFAHNNYDASFFVDCLVRLLNHDRPMLTDEVERLVDLDRVEFRASPKEVRELLELALKLSPKRSKILRAIKQKYLS